MKNIILIAMLFLTACTNYSSSMRGDMMNSPVDVTGLRKGESCSKSLFGGFSIPYVKETAIRLKGSEALIDAIKEGGINQVVFVDDSYKSYFFYTIRCKVVYGR